jgi:hypothetical protein
MCVGFSAASSLQISDGSGNLQDAVRGTGSQAQLGEGIFLRALPIRGEFREAAKVSRRHLGIEKTPFHFPAENLCS